MPSKIPCRFRHAAILCAGLALLGLAGAPAHAGFTPTSDFTDNGDGTVTHKPTKLTWMRCAMGQTWTGSTCSGDGSYYSWENAVALTSSFAGRTDWRLPTPWELASIVDFNASNPATNTTIFPNTAIAHYSIYSACGISNPCDLIPVAYYWTGLPSKNIGSNYYWYVDFVNGAVSGGFHDISLANRYSYYFARLVSNGNPLGTTTTPSADFTDNADGTVTHGKTNLAWMRCAVGQAWTGNSCSGAASTYNSSQATALSADFAGYSDWRLPNILELISIVEYGVSNPAINSAIFPATPSANFWSDSAYSVDFSSGGAAASSSSSSYTVRLVRAGQAGGTSTAMSDCLFNWAERTYSEWLAPSGAISNTSGDYYYRYYTTSNAYLATQNSDNHVYYLGILSGYNIMDLGALSGWLASAACK